MPTADTIKIDRTDSSIDTLKPFTWPTTLDTDFTTAAVDQARQAGQALSQSLVTITNEGVAAEKRSIANFQSTIDITDIPEQVREKLVKDAYTAAKKAGETERARQTDIYKGVTEIHEKNLADAQAQLDGLLSVAPNPAALLDILSTAELDTRLKYEQLFQHATYAAILTHAKRAISTGNRAMAAAVLSRLQALPRGDRPIGPNDFAEKIIGPLHSKLSLARDEVASLRASLAAAKKTAQSGKSPTNVETITRGLRQVALEKRRAEDALLGTAEEQ